MSDQPTIAAKQPAKVTLQAGKDYWFCACGKSASQPFCDGSHKDHFEHDAIAFDLPPKKA